MPEALGKHTSIASAQGRAHKYELQRVAAALLPEERVCWCCQRAHAPTVEIRKSGERCYYHGLAKCGSIWTCPICSSRISEQRREELKRAAAQPGYSMMLVTLTLQHSREDRLSDLLDALNEAWRRCKSGRAWQRIEEKYGIVASVSSLEITYGREAGFHPHKHVLVWSTLPEQELDVEAFKQELSARWRAALEKLSRYGSEFWSVDVRPGQQAAAGYVSKWGCIEEVSKSQEKRGSGDHYSMWQILELAGSGEAWCIPVFKQYAAAVRGRRWLFWSRGARAIFGLGAEQSDAELAEQEPEQEPAVVVCMVYRGDWSLVCKYNQREALLVAAESGGSDAVLLILERLRWRYEEERREVAYERYR